jgi:hypothetical protein
MIAKNTTIPQMDAAMARLNKQFHNNVEFRRLDVQGNKIIFTLKVKNSKGDGGAKSFRGRRTGAACWHCTGYLFVELFKINPNAKVYSSRTGWITADRGNFQDFNVGSIMEPMMASEACECVGR